MERRGLSTLPDDLTVMGWKLVSSREMRTAERTWCKVVYERPFAPAIDDDRLAFHHRRAVG